MIASFANKETEKLFASGKSRKLPSDILARAIMRLTQLDNAREVTDLFCPPRTGSKLSPVPGLGSGASGSTISGASVFRLQAAKQPMWK
jgi:toxin HigB-1